LRRAKADALPVAGEGHLETDGSGAQLGRYFLTEEAYGIVEKLGGHQAAYIGLHENA
jgi:hypothetical protein